MVKFQPKTIEELKQMVFDKYFEKKVIRYARSREGQSVSTYIDIANVNLERHHASLYEKYKFKKGWNEIQSEYVYQSFEAINKFEPVEDGESEKDLWIQIYKGTNEKQENKLLSYIRTTTKYKIYEYVNPDVFRTTTTKDGERIHYTLVMEMNSLEQLLYDDPAGIPPIQLTDSNAVFDNEMYEYYISYFQKWYEESREDILADSQLKFLDDLKGLSKGYLLTKEEYEEGTGTSWGDYSRRTRTIADRIKRHWVSEEPLKQSRRQVYTESKLKYLEGYIKLFNKMCYEDDVIETQNIRLTDYLIDGMKDKQVEYEVFQITNKKLDLEELRLFNHLVNTDNSKRLRLKTKTLFQIKENAEELIKSMRKNQRIKQEGRKVEAGPKPPEPEREKTTITTYDNKGNITGVQKKFIEDPIKHKNIFYILNTGAITDMKP